MIPEAAVEAAARRLYLTSPLGRRTCEAWEYIGEATQADYRIDATRILEAAAPHMLAEAKATALEELAADVSLRIDQIEAHHVPESEYGTLLAQREEADSIYRDILARAATYRPTT